MTTKTCSRCGATKSIANFHKKQVVNGRQYYRAECKDCTNASLRAVRQNEDVRSARAERARNHRKNNPEKYAAYYLARKEGKTEEQILKRRAYAREYAKKNKEKIDSYRTREKIQQWSSSFYQKHKEKIKLKNLEYKKRNLEKCREWRLNRESREKRDFLTPNIVKKLYELQLGRCACCGEKLFDDFHVDHITPLSRGGKNVDSNVQLLKSSCNMRKSSKDPIEYMQSKGYLL